MNFCLAMERINEPCGHVEVVKALLKVGVGSSDDGNENDFHCFDAAWRAGMSWFRA